MNRSAAARDDKSENERSTEAVQDATVSRQSRNASSEHRPRQTKRAVPLPVLHSTVSTVQDLYVASSAGHWPVQQSHGAARKEGEREQSSESSSAYSKTVSSHPTSSLGANTSVADDHAWGPASPVGLAGSATLVDPSESSPNLRSTESCVSKGDSSLPSVFRSSGYSPFPTASKFFHQSIQPVFSFSEHRSDEENRPESLCNDILPFPSHRSTKWRSEATFRKRSLEFNTAEGVQRFAGVDSEAAVRERPDIVRGREAADCPTVDEGPEASSCGNPGSNKRRKECKLHTSVQSPKRNREQWKPKIRSTFESPGKTVRENRKVTAHSPAIHLGNKAAQQSPSLQTRFQMFRAEREETDHDNLLASHSESENRAEGSGSSTLRIGQPTVCGSKTDRQGPNHAQDFSLQGNSVASFYYQQKGTRVPGPPVSPISNRTGGGKVFIFHESNRTRETKHSVSSYRATDATCSGRKRRIAESGRGEGRGYEDAKTFGSGLVTSTTGTRPKRTPETKASKTENNDDDAKLEIKDELVDDDRLHFSEAGKVENASTEPPRKTTHDYSEGKSSKKGNEEHSKQTSSDTKVQWKILFETPPQEASPVIDTPENKYEEDINGYSIRNSSSHPSSDLTSKKPPLVEITKIFKNSESGGDKVDGSSINETTGQLKNSCVRESATDSVRFCLATEPQSVGRRKQKKPRQIQPQPSKQSHLRDQRQIKTSCAAIATGQEKYVILERSKHFTGSKIDAGDSELRLEKYPETAQQTAPRTTRQLIHILTHPQKTTGSSSRASRKTSQNVYSVPRATYCSREYYSRDNPKLLNSRSDSQHNASLISVPEGICPSTSHVRRYTDYDVDAKEATGKCTDTSVLFPTSIDASQMPKKRQVSGLTAIKATKPATKIAEDDLTSFTAVSGDREISAKLKGQSSAIFALENLLAMKEDTTEASNRVLSSIDNHPLLKCGQALSAEDPNLSPYKISGEHNVRTNSNTTIATSIQSSKTSGKNPALDDRFGSRPNGVKTGLKVEGIQPDVRFSHLLQSFSRQAEDECAAASKRSASPSDVPMIPILKSSRKLTIPDPVSKCDDDDGQAEAIESDWRTSEQREDTRLSPGMLSRSIKDILSLKDGQDPKRPYRHRKARNMQARGPHGLTPFSKALLTHSPVVRMSAPSHRKQRHTKSKIKSEVAASIPQNLILNLYDITVPCNSEAREKAKIPKNSSQLLGNSSSLQLTPVSMVRIPLPIYPAAFPGVIPVLPQAQAQSLSSIPAVTTASLPSFRGQAQQSHYIPIVPKMPVVLPTLSTPLILENGSSSSGICGSFHSPKRTVCRRTPTTDEQAPDDRTPANPLIFPAVSVAQANESQMGKENEDVMQAAVAQIGIVSSQILPGNCGNLPVFLFVPNFNPSVVQCESKAQSKVTSASKTLTTENISDPKPLEHQDKTNIPLSSEARSISSSDARNNKPETSLELEQAQTEATVETISAKENDVSSCKEPENSTTCSPYSNKNGLSSKSAMLPNVPTKEKPKSTGVMKSGRRRTASTRYNSLTNIDFSDVSEYGDITPITSDEEWTPEKNNDGQAIVSSDEEEDTRQKSRKRDEFEDLFHPRRKKSSESFQQVGGAIEKHRSKRKPKADFFNKSALSGSKSDPQISDCNKIVSNQSGNAHLTSDQLTAARAETEDGQNTHVKNDPKNQEKRRKKNSTYLQTKTKEMPKRNVSRKRRKTPYTKDELTCRICFKVFINIYRLRRHEFSHGNERPYVCEVCGKAFKQSGHRNEHRLTHSANKRSFLCNVCGLVISSRSSFRYHLLSHNQLLEGNVSTSNSGIETPAAEAGTSCKPAAVSDKVSDNTFSTSGAANLPRPTADVSTGPAAYDCPHCVDRFATAQSLNCHLESHKEVEARCHVQPFTCSECGRSFTYRHNLEKHRASHVMPEKRADSYQKKVQAAIAAGKPHFDCDTCGKVYLRKETLNKHRRTHLGLKPYQCLVCQKRFTQKIHLTVHSRLHTGSRPFQCRTCHCCFLDSTALARHVERDVCKTDGFTFNVGKRGRKPFHVVMDENLKSVVQNNKDHQREGCKGAVSLKCGLCSWSGRRHGFLWRHIGRCHPQLADQALPDFHSAASTSSTDGPRSSEESSEGQHKLDFASASLETTSVKHKGPAQTTQCLQSEMETPTVEVPSKVKPPSIGSLSEMKAIITDSVVEAPAVSVTNILSEEVAPPASDLSETSTSCMVSKERGSTTVFPIETTASVDTIKVSDTVFMPSGEAAPSSIKHLKVKGSKANSLCLAKIPSALAASETSDVCMLSKEQAPKALPLVKEPAVVDLENEKPEKDLTLSYQPCVDIYNALESLECQSDTSTFLSSRDEAAELYQHKCRDEKSPINSKVIGGSSSTIALKHRNRKEPADPHCLQSQNPPTENKQHRSEEDLTMPENSEHPFEKSTQFLLPTGRPVGSGSKSVATKLSASVCNADSNAALFTSPGDLTVNEPVTNDLISANYEKTVHSKKSTNRRRSISSVSMSISRSAKCKRQKKRSHGNVEEKDQVSCVPRLRSARVRSAKGKLRN